MIGTGITGVLCGSMKCIFQLFVPVLYYMHVCNNKMETVVTLAMCMLSEISRSVSARQPLPQDRDESLSPSWGLAPQYTYRHKFS